MSPALLARRAGTPESEVQEIILEIAWCHPGKAMKGWNHAFD